MISIDPFHKYDHTSPGEMIAALGYLPNWVKLGNEKTFKEQLEKGYPFPVEWSKDAPIRNGIFEYPGDAPLYPVLVLFRNNECLYFYANAFVGYTDGEQSLYCRMD